jgi:hypothetical protein
MALLRENLSYELWVDMDGVLTDFDAQLKQMCGIKNGRAFEAKYGKQEFWHRIDVAGLEFWSDMPWMPDGKQLWSFLKKMNLPIFIITAPASLIPESMTGKRMWVSKNLGSYPIYFSQTGKKGKFARKNRILIDDMMKNIDSWKTHGLVIHHTSTSDTISKLNQIVK